MALNALVYPQDSFGYGCKELYTLGGANGWGYEAYVEMLENNSCMEQCLHGSNNWESSSSSIIMQNSVKDWDQSNFNNNTSSPEACTGGGGGVDLHQQQLVLEGSPLGPEAVPPAAPQAAAATTSRRKRRRTKSSKNKEELENQRMTHITVERNRRKQMNEYLAVIRFLMPASYVQRGDQASIIAGAINFVKELEQQLQTLEAQKRALQPPSSNDQSPLFANFFTFPQYSTRPTHPTTSTPQSATNNEPLAAQNRSALAEIEVTMVESHANLKILSKKRPRQLLKIVAGLQCLWLSILHVNVTTVDQMVLYSVSVKLEDGCQLSTVDEIADAVNQLLGRIEEEAALSSKPETLLA